MPVIETFNGPLFKGNIYTPANSLSNQQAGRSSIGSGDATVTVSTTAVKSDSIIQLAIESNTRQNSGVARGIEVSSIVDSSYFILASADGTTITRDMTVMWRIWQTQ